MYYGGVTMKDIKNNSFNIDILKSKKTRIVSSAEALKDITSINWSKQVLSGEKKVVVTK